MTNGKVKVGDRVKRLDTPGSVGTVKEVRSEVVGTSGEVKDKGLLVKVHWDSSTVSYLAPEALEVVSKNG